MSAIRKKEKNLILLVQKYFQQKHNVSHFECLECTICPGCVFIMHVGVIPSRFQGEGARPKNHLEPMMGMIEIGNRLRARLARAARSKPADTQKWVFSLWMQNPGVLQH